MRGVLIGAGFIAQFQAEAWRRIAGVELVAVADLAPGRAKGFASKHCIARAHESVEAMIEAEKPDFVDIATRPEAHLPLTRLAAQHGIHVLCQKPMAPTMAECVAMCEACETAKVRLLIHENCRWQPWFREAKRLLETGVPGPLRRLSFDWRTGDGNGPEPFAEQPYFRQMPRLIIHESLVHMLDTFRYLGGGLSITACATRRVNPILAGEDWAEIRVRFDDGASGFIHGDRQTGPMPPPVAMGSMRMECERATLRIAPDGQIFVAKNDGGEERLPFEPTRAGYKGDSVFAVQRHFIECLRTGQPAESEGRAYLETVALVEECYRLSPQPQPAHA